MISEINNSKGREWKDHFRIFKALSQQMQTIGKSPEIIEALEKFRNNDNLAKWMNSVLPKGDGSDSKLMTIVHGDCWTNNFFVNEERTKVRNGKYVNSSKLSYHKPTVQIHLSVITG